MPDAERVPDERDLAGKDPLEVLRAALAISPEDAKQAREDAANKGSVDDGGQSAP
jgi:hypothetical protein